MPTADGSGGEDELDVARERIADLEARLAAQGTAPTGEEQAGRKAHGSHRVRRIAVVLLLVLGTVLTPVTIVALFVQTEITDTDRYVANVAPLGDDPAIQAYVAEQVSDELLAQVDVRTYVAEALPEQAQRLVGPIASAMESFVREATLRVLQSPQFQDVWIGANRVAHDALVRVLTGKGDGAVEATDEGAVTVDLSAVAGQVQSRLEETGIEVFSRLPVARIGGEITVFQSQDLYRARRAVGVLDTLALVLPLLVFASLGAAVALSRDRRRGFLAAAVCFAVGAATLSLLLRVGRSFYLDAVTEQVPRDPAAAVYDTLTRFLYTSVRAALLFGAIVLVAVFFAGPSRPAAWFRTSVRTAANRLGAESERAGWTWLGPQRLVVRYKRVLRVVAAAVAFTVLVRWEHPTPAVIFWAAVLTLLVLAVVEFFGREPGPPVTQEAAPERDRTPTPPPGAAPVHPG